MRPTAQTPVESTALWAIHRATRSEMRRRGYCQRCAEQIAFAVTDLAEGRPAREPDLCERCKLVHESRRAA